MQSQSVLSSQAALSELSSSGRGYYCQIGTKKCCRNVAECSRGKKYVAENVCNCCREKNCRNCKNNTKIVAGLTFVPEKMLPKMQPVNWQMLPECCRIVAGSCGNLLFVGISGYNSATFRLHLPIYRLHFRHHFSGTKVSPATIFVLLLHFRQHFFPGNNSTRFRLHFFPPATSGNISATFFPASFCKSGSCEAGLASIALSSGKPGLNVKEALPVLL